MTSNTKNPASANLPEDLHPEEIFTAVHSVASHLQLIEKFIARRFDEISMEINATSQQVDMAESGIATRFGEILEVIKAVSYSGDGSTAANAGVELDAIVETTANAANRILDAAERIGTHIANGREAKNDSARIAVFDAIENDVQEIFLACSFQDLTSQRINKTLDNLRDIEDRLGTALDKMGIKVDVKPENHQDIKAERSSQDDIDGLFD
jgi:chemotaxis regulatin CheY-phosphate phosphatase CheZ